MVKQTAHEKHFLKSGEYRNLDDHHIAELPEVVTLQAQHLKERRRQTSRFMRAAKFTGEVALVVGASIDHVTTVAERARKNSRHEKDGMMKALVGAVAVAGSVLRPLTSFTKRKLEKHDARRGAEYQQARVKAVADFKANETSKPKIDELEAKNLRSGFNKALERTTTAQSTMTRAVNNPDYPNRNSGARRILQEIPAVPSDRNKDAFYMSVAKNTLGMAIDSDQLPDGSVVLASPDLRAKHRATAIKERENPYSFARSQEARNEGVATALWQMGFVETTPNDDYPLWENGHSTDIARSKVQVMSPEGVTTVNRLQIPFDSENDLHRMLLPEGADTSNLTVALDIYDDPRARTGAIGAEHMNLQLLPAELPTQQTHELVAA